MKRKIIYIVSILFCFITESIYAQSERFGKWHSNPIKEGTEQAIIEYHFINDSVLSMAVVTDNHIVGVGRCISQCSICGTYNKYGPFFFVSLNQRTLKVDVIKYESLNKSMTQEEILTQLISTARVLFEGYDNVRMIYVTHESPDTISFIYGDENNAMEIEFHRSNEPLEGLFSNDELDCESESSGAGNIEPEDQEYQENDIPLSSQYEIPIEYDNADTTNKSDPMIQMWKSMGIFMLYLLLSYLIVMGVKYIFIKRISRKNSANKSVCIRKIYYATRFILRIVVIIIGVIVWGKLLFDSYAVSKYITISVLCGGGGLFLSLLSSISLPVSFMTMKELKKDKSFVLYLRGFVTDDYSPKMEEYANTVSNARPWIYDQKQAPAKSTPNLLPLNEKALSSSWKRNYLIYSVGLPEELESPEGSVRIYLDNEKWKEDAFTLMTLAEYILICVHSNVNCIWEIKQCNLNFSQKTIYYIDDINKLASVKEQMGDELPICLRSDALNKSHMVSYQIGDEIITKLYTNNEDGLSAITRGILSQRREKI